MSNIDAKTVDWTIDRQVITEEPVQTATQYYTGGAITAIFDDFKSR